jgi:site-specific DNA recombinase
VWTQRQVIEDEVHDWLLRVREEIDAIVAGRIVISVPKGQPGAEAKRRRLRADISRFTAALDRASEGHALGDIPRDSYLRTRDKFTKERDEAQRQLDELDVEAQPRPTPLPHRETVEGLIEEWDTISVKSKRVALATLIRRVEIWPESRVVVVPVWPSAGLPGQRA